MRTPASVLADLLRADAARPRVTFYEDTPGPTRGERIELSGKVLANWVNKAANALQDEYDLGPGSVVRLDLPTHHWRTLYWALATWSVGATLDLEAAAQERRAQLLVTADVQRVAGADVDQAVVVTLAALARRHPDQLPGGVMDEARELATYGDQFTPWAEPAPSDLALVAGERQVPGASLAYGTGLAYGTEVAHGTGLAYDTELAYDAVVGQRDWPVGSRVYLGGEGAGVLSAALAAWALDGSVVLVRHPDPSLLEARLKSEGVTVRVD